MAVHCLKGPLSHALCGAHKRGADIHGTRFLQRVTCKGCLRSLRKLERDKEKQAKIDANITKCWGFVPWELIEKRLIVAAAELGIHCHKDRKEEDCEVHKFSPEQWQTGFVALVRERYNRGGVWICLRCFGKVRRALSAEIGRLVAAERETLEAEGGGSAPALPALSAGVRSAGQSTAGRVQEEACDLPGMSEGEEEKAKEESQMTRITRKIISITPAHPGTRAVYLIDGQRDESPVLLFAVCEFVEQDSKTDRVVGSGVEVCGLESHDDGLNFCEEASNFIRYLAPGESLFATGTPESDSASQ